MYLKTTIAIRSIDQQKSCHSNAQELSQRALVSYLRSVFLQPNRAVFDVSALPVSLSHCCQAQNDCTARSTVSGLWLRPSSAARWGCDGLQAAVH